MMFMQNVAYLEASDFDSSDDSKSPTLLQSVSRGRPTVVMLQSSGCGHCTTAKPAYQKLAEGSYQEGPVLYATIQADEQQDIARVLMGLKDLQGVPSYIGFNSDGSLGPVHSGGRDENSLKEFGSSLA